MYEAGEIKQPQVMLMAKKSLFVKCIKIRNSIMKIPGRNGGSAHINYWWGISQTVSLDFLHNLLIFLFKLLINCWRCISQWFSSFLSAELHRFLSKDLFSSKVNYSKTRTAPILSFNSFRRCLNKTLQTLSCRPCLTLTIRLIKSCKSAV